MDTVLVIDDEPCVRDVIHALLEREFHVVEAGSGKEGLLMAAKEHPQVILLDYRLPGLDGPATISRLKADPSTREIPVIIMSGLGEMANAGGLNASAFVNKPFRRAELIEELHRATRAPVSTATLRQKELAS
jgi:CheY-like chemotaxis protein